MELKHGKLYKNYADLGARARSQLNPIQEYIRHGFADARQSITIYPERCDAVGAQKFNPQMCVLAKALKRVFRPSAVSVGRTSAWIIKSGIAYRFRLSQAKFIDNFDRKGLVTHMPITFYAPTASAKLFTGFHEYEDGNNQRRKAKRKKKNSMRSGVRTVNGGIS